jgi:acyl carrier protein
MSDHLDDVVRRAIAKQLGIDRNMIDPLHDLRSDLHLQPLDLVLIVLTIEDAARIQLPAAHLAAVATVSGLTTLVRRACAGHAYDPGIVPIYRRYRRSRRFARRPQEA